MTAPAARSSPVRFLVLASVWAASLLWLIRLPAIERALIQPLTALQGRIALWYTGSATLPVTVTLACSGADVLAVCLAATLAYPLPWTRRIAGALGGALLVLSLNTVRIGILAHAVGSPWFTLLHEHILPALLVLSVVLWLVLWLQFADPRPGAGLSRPGRIVVASAAALGLYVAAGPWLQSSGWLLSAAFGAARASGWLLNTIGIPCTVAGNLLHTPHADVIVTTECVVTPLMPVYLAVALTVPSTWGRRMLAVAGFVPLFSLLIVVRLLTVALPPVVGGTPLVLTHAFHQIVLGLVTVVLMRWWAAGAPGRVDVVRIVIACAAGAATLFVLREIAPAAALAMVGWLRPFAAHVPRTLLVAGDIQGALYLLPSFACALLVALLVVAPPGRWPGFALTAFATGVLVIAWIAAQAELAAHFGIALPVVWTRAAGVAAPLLAVLVARSLHDASPLRAGVRRQRRAHAPGGVAGR
jgi:exosortase/archaeosortase family protein